MILKKLFTFLLNYYYRYIFILKRRIYSASKVTNIDYFKKVLLDKSESLHKIDFVEGYSIFARGRDLVGVIESCILEDYTKNIKVGPGMIVYDLGSCIGDFAILAAYRGATVVAIEPDKTNYEILVKNIELNGLSKKITPLNIAIDCQTGTSGFKNTAQNSGGYTLDENSDLRVITKTISDVMDELGHTYIDLLKIDVEGSEYSIFSNPKTANFSKVKIIVGEYHLDINKLNFSWKNLESYLKPHFSEINKRTPYYFEAHS